MSVPDDIRRSLRKRLREIADRVGWVSLSAAAKSRLYEDWTRDPEVGGLLARYIDKGQIRVYIKDTLLKDYARERLGDDSRPLRVAGIPVDAKAAEVFIKPHGRRFGDGRIVCWARADDWKSVLMALYERAYTDTKARPFAAVLMRTAGRFQDEAMRALVEDAAKRLGIERLVWLDT